MLIWHYMHLQCPNQLITFISAQFIFIKFNHLPTLVYSELALTDAGRICRKQHSAFNNYSSNFYFASRLWKVTHFREQTKTIYIFKVRPISGSCWTSPLHMWSMWPGCHSTSSTVNPPSLLWAAGHLKIKPLVYIS